MDEPTTNLDANRRAAFSKILTKLQEMGKIIIISSHSLEEMIIADVICIVEDGYVKESGSHKELIENSEIYKSLTGKEIID